MRGIRMGLWAVLAMAALACGGKISEGRTRDAPNGGTTGASGGTPTAGHAAGRSVGAGGAATGGSGGNPCDSAAVDLACATEGTTCSSGCAQRCEPCLRLTCARGVWEELESFPGCFDCGPIQCRPYDEYCLWPPPNTPPGVVAEITCQPMPEACVPDADPSLATYCTCFETVRGPIESCTESAGQVTVTGCWREDCGRGGAGGGGEGGAGGAATCTELAFEDLGEIPSGTECPVDLRLPECASESEPTVVRTEECLAASQVANGCEPWPLDAERMLVLLPGQLCTGHTLVDAVTACDGDDSIQVEYRQVQSCSPCDGLIPTVHVVELSLDARPVTAAVASWPEGGCFSCPDLDCSSSCPEGYWFEPDRCEHCACAPPALRFNAETTGVTLDASVSESSDGWELQLTFSHDAGGNAPPSVVTARIVWHDSQAIGPFGSTRFIPEDALTIEVTEATHIPALAAGIEMQAVLGYLSVRREGPRLVGGLSLTLAGSDPEGTLVTVAGPFETLAP